MLQVPRGLNYDVASTLAAELQSKGYSVREHMFRTLAGTWKSDILAAKDGEGHVVDVQVISGAHPLAEGHNRKRQYYAGNGELLGKISSLLQVPLQRLRVTTATLSWRGVWAKESAAALGSMDVSRAIMRGITTRVIMGSLMNFMRFNQTTEMARGRANLRMSG